MNYPLIVGIVALFFAVVFSLISLDMLAVSMYAVATFSIMMALLTDKKVEDSG